MDNKKKKSEAYKILILLSILIPVILGFSYAYFLARINGNQTLINGGITNRFDFELQTNNNGYINATDLIPISSSEVNDLAEVGTFNVVTGNNTNKVIYSISLEELTISDNLKSSKFKWILECTNDSSKTTSGNFMNVSGNSKILFSDKIINANTTDYFRLKLFIEDDGTNQISMINGHFSAKISATAKLIYE